MLASSLASPCNPEWLISRVSIKNPPFLHSPFPTSDPLVRKDRGPASQPQVDSTDPEDRARVEQFSSVMKGSQDQMGGWVGAPALPSRVECHTSDSLCLAERECHARNSLSFICCFHVFEKIVLMRTAAEILPSGHQPLAEALSSRLVFPPSPCSAISAPSCEQPPGVVLRPSAYQRYQLGSASKGWAKEMLGNLLVVCKETITCESVNLGS